MFTSLPSARKQVGLFKLGLMSAVLFGFAAQARGQCSAPANPVVAENCLQGTPSSTWDINNGDGGDPTIQGFSTDISVNHGGTIYFKIDTPASAYTIDIYRMGYYGGLGARKITSISPSAKLPQSQPTCLGNTTTGLTDCGNWAISASWQVPATATSGIYFAHLTRTDTGGDSQIIFIVRNDSSTSDILYQTSDTTWQAYNYYGNGSLYGPGQPVFGLSVRAYEASYNRPVLTRGFNDESATFVFGAEFAMVQWLEANGYDVSYSSAVDTDRNGSLIKNHKVFMDSGHDEYVSSGARANIQAARDAGVNLAFFSGNEIFWKTRFVNSIDGTNTPYRTIDCYKETLAFAKIDPEDPPTWTGTWRDPTFSPPADGGLPENALTGTLFMVNGVGDDNPGNLAITVPAADGKMRFWRNTAVATLAPGTSYTLVPGSLGYEWDEDVDNGFRPAGAFRLSTTTYNLTTDFLLDYGATYGAGTATHHLMMYRAPSGALVFGAGTIDWAYGLNSSHDDSFGFPNPNPDINMEQATVNLFADMGAQPATIQPGLSIASKSTDVVPPHSTILTPTVGSNVSTGGSITVTGTATDTNGVVAGVEFSPDGGTTWHPANGRANWTYSWTPSVAGSTTLLSRSVDDSGNLETPSDGVIVSVSPQTCPCTIFGSNAPTTADSGDGNAVEVGVKFRADSNGSIIGVRFYKSAANTGTHIGHMWTDTGQLLGEATFTNESNSGWQQVNFSTPISATANTNYVASYFAPAGHYAADMRFFLQSGYDDPPLHALADGVDGGDGVYVYSTGGTFPTSTSDSTNYWVDVIYSSSNTYSISGSISGVGGAGATVTITGPESLSTSADPSGNFSLAGVVSGTYTVSVSNPGVSFSPPSQNVNVNFAVVTGVNFVAAVSNPLTISGSITGGAGATVTLAGTANLTTTADNSGNYSFTGLLSGSYTVTPSEASYIFTPSTHAITLSGGNASSVNFQGQVCTCISIWGPSNTPATADSGDANPVELGVRFTADSPAYLVGLRFYKAATNLGTHVGHLWSNTGQLLATATFPGETASGWQQGYFSTPYLINAGTPYVASYLAPDGHYSASGNYFATSGTDRPPLHALQNGIDGSDGIYIYSSTGAFPTNTYNATNYWVDVLYAAQQYTVSGTISGAGGAGATLTLSGNGQATTTADASGNFTFTGVYPGSYSITPSNSGYVFVPGNQNVSVSQANVTGVSFSVPQICPCDTVWQPATHPTNIDSGDPQSVELGVKVRADSDGYILGIRFYKAPANTGSHIANLWSGPAAGGSLLSTTPFANESASGWQQAMFTNPVPVVANTTYVASYFAPVGHYSADTLSFASAGVDSPPLHALESGVDGQNGVFAYGTTSSLPSNSYNAGNYWVDVIYAATATHSIAGTITGPGAAGATVALQGPVNATTITDGNGNYSFSGVTDGSYTVTATESGFVYSPASLPVTISGAHDLSANFTSTIVGYSVSGTVSGAPGIAVTLSGATTQTTAADSSGNYTFATVPNGSYTVTPAGVGFTVSPSSQSVSVNGSAVSNVNFTATVNLYSISGMITGGAGVTVSLIGASTVTTVADSSGNYAFSGIAVGSYTVTSSITPGVVFNPGSISVVLNGTNVSGVNFAVPQNCPCDTIWPSSAVPGSVDSGDSNSVELGVKFRADADAYITGLRFYKASTNTGTHLGRIWTDSGTLLGTATFTGESSSGWQQVFFSTPMPVAANTSYVASYFAPSGHYSADMLYFANAGVNTPPLHALANGVDGANGVFDYSSAGGFPSQSVQNNAINYWVDVIYAPSTTYSITGNVIGTGGPGATVALSGSSTATTTADTSGNFAFNGLANGSYVVTPSESGFAYTPVSQSATINNTHALGLTFSSASGYTITGTISGPGGAGTLVTLTGPTSATTTANASGGFTFSGLSNGTYTVAVSGTGYVFTPASQSATVSGANLNVSFSSVAQTYSISGTITGPGGNGATVNLTGAATATTTANASGAFSFTGLSNGAYTVAVSKIGYVFTPASQPVTVSGANLNVSVSSVAQTYSISGTITGPGGNGATVNLTGAATATTTANASGAFSFTGLSNGAYTVAVSKTGYVFTPASQPVTVSGANLNVSVSSVAQTYSISGTITGPGGNGATVNLTGAATATTTANASGAFSFTGLSNGAYTVAVSKTGYVFTPTSQPVTVSGANLNVSFSSVVQRPSLTSIAPTTIVRSAAAESVVITGTELTGATAITAAGTGVTCTITGTPTATTVNGSCSASATAGLGTRAVTVVTPNGNATGTNVNLTVGAPTFTSINPANGVRGSIVNVTIAGTNLIGSSTPAVSGTGVTVSNYTVASATSATATFTIAASAGTGARTVSVTGNNGTVQFEVTGGTATFTGPTPALTSVPTNTKQKAGTITVTNSATGATAGPLTFTAAPTIAKTGGNGTGTFAITLGGSCTPTQVLISGGSCTIAVQYTPLTTGLNDTGNATGTVTITDTGATTATQTYSFTAN